MSINKITRILNSSYFLFLMGFISWACIITPANKFKFINYIPLCLSVIIIFYIKKRKKENQ
ncbi:hypothetical protein FM106_22505 [Brachybacterium faecium]|nr:hypothetical protein FM106_22505 [Brachybacterium faecium]